ncbi:MAG: MarC family protein [Reichenbachiella sp.]|uniref:MarC family protein n=1 Tax=Reichenbachiella sp. TaxID=2184521 RepID=UPI0032654BB3
MQMNFTEVLSVSLILFSIIDIVGNIPIVINLRKKTGTIHSARATIVAGLIMVIFLFLGDKILGLFGIDIGSFAIAGALIMFLIGMEMVLGIELFRSDAEESGSSSIVPIAFPLIAGPGTMTSLISLRAEYELTNILVGIVVNLLLVYAVLKSSSWLEKKIGHAGFDVIRKVFGIILLAISIKLFKNGLAIW